MGRGRRERRSDAIRVRTRLCERNISHLEGLMEGTVTVEMAGGGGSTVLIHTVNLISTM